MAKKSKGFELDEYGFSDSLEIPDFGFDAPPVKDDRNPATKIAGAIATGAKAQVTSPAFIRDLVKKSLPRGYGEAMEFADSTAGSVKGLYNDAAKEIKPVIKDLRRTTKRLMPTLEATLPKSVSDKIKKWSEAEDRDLKSISAEQQREASIQMQLGEIFHLQAKADLQRDASTEARNVLKEGIDQGRHRDQLGQLDAMRISLQQMANYQSKIDSGFQRKSLELQFRSYFLAQEAFEEQKRFSVESKTHLEGILKNTALPEYAKLKGSERFAEVMRNKFINGVQDGLIGNRGGFVNKVAGKLSGVVKDKVSTYASNFKMALDGVDMAQDMNQMRREMGDNRSNAEFGGEMAGGMIADNLATRAGKRIRKMIPADGKIAKYGNKLRFGVRNAPQLMTDWANTDSWNTPTRTGPGGKILNTLDDNGIFGGLGSALKEAIRSANSVDNTLTGDKAGGMQDHAVFNRGASKSITEIIPGYLARIYRELQIMRTGNPNIDLSTYDFGSNKFSDKASVAKKILDSTVGTYDKERLKTDTDSALDEIDPDKKLTEEQRRLLAKHMLKDNTRNRSGSFKRLSNASEYSGPAGRHAEVYAELFAELAKKDPNGKKQNDFAEKFSRIGYSISDKRKDIQDHLNTGNREILEELGFIDKDTDQINMERIHSYLLGEDYTPGMATNGAAQFRSGSKLNKNVRRPSSPFEQVNPARPAGTGYRDTDDSTKVSGSTNGLISAIKESSAKAASETINETLLRIEKKINEGIDLRGGGDGTGGGSGGPNGKPGSGPWWNRSVKNLAGDAWGLGKKGFGKAKGFATDMFNRGVNLGGKGIGLGKDLFDKATEKWKGIKDVWIDGEFTPRLLAWKIKAGKYRDQATGAIIKSYKDIKGAVIDEDGNIILTAEQAREAFVKNGVVQKAIKLLGAGVGKIKDLGDRLMSKIPPAIKFAKDLAIKAYGLLKLPQDVYTKDKPDVPTLLAKTMKSGGYVSRITSKVIQNTDDIDGPVFDERGNEVLTADDFAKGLYDSKGRPIRNGFGKITGAAKDAFRFAKDKLTRGGKFLKDKVSGAWNMAKNALRDGIHIGGLGPGETRLDKDSLIIKRLTEIRNILDGRLPGKKKKIVGDIDSDGIREGSWADKMKKKKDAAVDKAKEMAAAAKDKGSSIFGMMSGGIGSLLSKLKGKDKDAEEGEDGKSLTEMAEQSLMDRFLGGGRNKDDKATGKKGRFGRFKDSAKGRFGKVKAGAKDKFGKARDSAKDKFGKVKDGARDRYGNMKNSAKNTIKHPGRNVGAKIGGGIGKALPFAGAALGAYGAYNAIQEGNYGEAALDAGLGLGSLAMSGGIAGAATGAGAAAGMLGSGAMALGGGFMTAGGVVLSGLGAVLASPVVLGALALAAVGTVGYLGYKYLTKKKLDIWSKVRYAQYGFLPTDEDRVGQVFGLEDKLMSAVKYDNGIAQLDETKLKVGDVMKDFKVDVENRKELSNWLTWFTKRFKPVFLTHLSVLNATAPGKTLNDIEKLKPEEKKKYLDGAKYPDGPYNVLVSPFPGSDSLAAGGTEVKNAVEAAQTEVTKLMEEAKKDGTDTAKEVGKAATVLGATGLALAATTPKGVDTTLDSSKLKQIIDKTGSSIGIDGKASILSVTGVAVGLDSYGSGRID
ncbi:MAG: Virion structural protein, partial [uncultured bacterium]